ncbi:MAG: uroporphyrinogen-III synthase, partial [Caulobacteraceae bacterium]
VLIHSPKAGRRVARMVEKPSTMAVYAISEEALAPLRHLPFRQFAAARFPNEVSLLSLLAT